MRLANSLRENNSSDILTDSPYKNTLSSKKNKSNTAKDSTKKINKSLSSKATSDSEKNSRYRSKNKKINKRHDEYESENESDPFCLVCVERFSTRRGGEKWIRCVACKGWAHQKCTPNNGLHYVCHHCDSDDEWVCEQGQVYRYTI